MTHGLPRALALPRQRDATGERIPSLTFLSMCPDDFVKGFIFTVRGTIWRMHFARL